MSPTEHAVSVGCPGGRSPALTAVLPSLAAAPCYLSQHPLAFQKGRHACAEKRHAGWRSAAPGVRWSRPPPRAAGGEASTAAAHLSPQDQEGVWLGAGSRRTLLRNENTSSFRTHFLSLWKQCNSVRPGSLFYCTLEESFPGEGGSSWRSRDG